MSAVGSITVNLSGRSLWRDIAYRCGFTSEFRGLKRCYEALEKAATKEALQHKREQGRIEEARWWQHVEEAALEKIATAVDEAGARGDRFVLVETEHMTSCRALVTLLNSDTRIEAVQLFNMHTPAYVPVVATHALITLVRPCA